MNWWGAQLTGTRALVSAGLLVLLAFLFQGCAGAGGSGGPGASAAASRCQPMSPQLSEAITAGLKIQGGGSLRGGQTVKSTGHENVWMVSADLEGPGLSAKDNIATWATNDIRGGGSIFSVDAVAREFSQWGTGPGFGLGDDGVTESKACVAAVLR